MPYSGYPFAAKVGQFKPPNWTNLEYRNQFAEITAKRIRRGTFLSVKELTRAIQAYIHETNRTPKPFVWTTTAKSILRKLKKYKESLDTGH
jgi:hypothetical protein